MGKRGPERGGKYRKRILVPRHLPVDGDGQLVAAQHFNERVEQFLITFDEGRYPVSHLEPELIEQMVEAVELVQSAVVDGIEGYFIRAARPPLDPDPL